MKATGSKKPGKSLQYYMRTIHRYLGYLALGMVIIYALSGIVLIHRTGDFMKHEVKTEQTLEAGLDSNSLGSALKIKNFRAIEENEQTIVFAEGTYNRLTGEVSYTRQEVIAPFNKFIDLHKLPDAKNHHIAVATSVFGVILFLLGLTSLFMYKTSTRQFKVNMVLTALGVAAAVLLVVFA